MAWAVSPDTLIAVTSAPPPEANAFVYPRGPVRAPDGRLHLLEAYGQQINTPVTLVTYDPATGQWVEPPQFQLSASDRCSPWTPSAAYT
jgi:hypothetical protein